MPLPVPAVERVLRRITKLENGCWDWCGAKTDGYGQVGVGSRRDGSLHLEYVHRVTYEHFYGPIPAGLQLDHICRNRACVRPDHLRAVTLMENVMAPGSLAVQARNAAKTHCLRGHALSGKNIKPERGKAWRRCRTCCNVRDRALKARRKVR